MDWHLADFGIDALAFLRYNLVDRESQYIGGSLDRVMDNYYKLKISSISIIPNDDENYSFRHCIDAL